MTVRSPDSNLAWQLSERGLHVFGGFEILDEDCPSARQDMSGKVGVLIGNAGGNGLWSAFSGSVEYGDGQPNQLDRWTARVCSELASSFCCSVLFPFEKPWWPFQKFAQRAVGARQSPLGLIIHPKFGIWHAFRAVLVFSTAEEMKSHFSGLDVMAEKLNHPCDECVGRPCLSACPVKAYDEKGFDRLACANHLAQSPAPDCLTNGCHPRFACPLASEYQYPPDMIRFLMREVVAGQKARGAPANSG